MSHSHRVMGSTPPRVRRLLLICLAPFALATVVGLIVLWPRHRFQPDVDLGTPAQLVDGTVTSVVRARCPAGGVCATARVRLSGGPERGQTVSLEDLTFGPGVPEIHSGDRIVLGRTVDPTTGDATYYFSDYQRRAPMVWAAFGFAVLVCAVARWRGAAAIAGLGVTWVVLVKFVIPAILDGRSPVAVALVGSAAIMFVVLYLAHGLNARTTTALLGTLVSLSLTGVLASIVVSATRLTGLSSDEATYLQTVAGSISLSGLILAGIVIGSLGVLNDVTVTQASALWEIHDADRARSRRDLYRSGMRVGRDHIASTIYTLVLAYAGASLPLFILFSVANQGLSTIVTGDLVAEEVVRAVVGSIGLVASVPLTTAIAAVVVTAGPRPPSDQP